jgi:hypothetical protein
MEIIIEKIPLHPPFPKGEYLFHAHSFCMIKCHILYVPIEKPEELRMILRQL